jgi:hypothetical protein
LQSYRKHSAVVLLSFHYRITSTHFVMNSRSLCKFTKIASKSHCNYCAAATRSLYNRFAIGSQRRCANIVQSVCKPFCHRSVNRAIAFCDRIAIAFVFALHSCSPCAMFLQSIEMVLKLMLYALKSLHYFSVTVAHLLRD